MHQSVSGSLDFGLAAAPRRDGERRTDRSRGERAAAADAHGEHRSLPTCDQRTVLAQEPAGRAVGDRPFPFRRALRIAGDVAGFLGLIGLLAVALFGFDAATWCAYELMLQLGLVGGR